MACLPANGQHRISTVGTIEHGVLSGNLQRTSNARKAFDGPRFLFSADFAMENWILAGTPVHSCGVEWYFTDKQGNRSDDFVYVANLSEAVPQAEWSPVLYGNQSEVYQALEADPAIDFMENGIIRIRRNALSYGPELYNLDFLVPLDALGSHTTPAGDQIVYQFHSVRCLTGALGGPESDHFNTPYAFDIGETLLFRDGLAPGRGGSVHDTAILHGDRVGRYRSEAEARVMINFMVNTIAAQDPGRIYRASADDVYVTDIAFNMRPVLEYVESVLREASNRRAAELRALRRIQRQQRIEEKIASGKRAELNEIPERERTFAEALQPADSVDAIMARMQESVSAEIEVRAFDVSDSPIVREARRSEVAGSDRALEEASERLTEIESALEEFRAGASLQQAPAPRDLALYRDAVPQDPGALFLQAATLDQQSGLANGRRCIENCGSSFVLVSCRNPPCGRPPRREKVYETYQYFQVNSTITAELRDPIWQECTYLRSGQDWSHHLDAETGVFLWGFNSAQSRYLEINCPGFESATIDFWAQGLLPAEPEACRRHSENPVCREILDFLR